MVNVIYVLVLPYQEKNQAVEEFWKWEETRPPFQFLVPDGRSAKDGLATEGSLMICHHSCIQ
jgi:hypothetical protein